MADRTQLFRSKAPWIMNGLISEFDLTENQAAGILGNIGHRGYQFHQMQEGRPRGDGRGGYGWCQWTASRRNSFEQYAKKRELSVDGDEANYGYLIWELRNTEKAAIRAVKKTETVKDAVREFEKHFERAGVKHYDRRDEWAQIALKAYREHSFEYGS